MDKEKKDKMKKLISKKVGKRISYYRNQNNLTQEQLEVLADLGDRYLGFIERGASITSLVYLVSIANALKVSADQLLVDVLDVNLPIKATILSEKMKDLPVEKQKQILDFADYIINENEK